MAVNSKHPDYDKMLPDWTLMTHAHKGEREIKAQGLVYLPATSGMIADGMGKPETAGQRAYDAYKRRARFPDFVFDAIEALVGVLHQKPPKIELPPKMEPLRELATSTGEGLEALLRRINEQQILTGRVGLLLDVQDGRQVGSLPYISMYRATTVINWDDGTRDGLTLQNLNMVALDESEYERDTDFDWKYEQKTRIAILGDSNTNEAAGSGAVYRVGVFRDNEASFDESQLITPSIAGRELNEIPFTFINSKDIVPAPDKPPLLGLGELCVAIYRAEADYRQALFMQGQDTLVVMGAGDPEEVFRTGAGASINVPLGGDAKYIGVESSGLSEMRSSLENDRVEAAGRGGSMLDAASRQKESGDALHIRVSAQTANLNQVAMTGALGLQTCLRQIARWIGAPEDQVVVTPNLDFVDDVLEGKTLIEYLTAKSLGAPFSQESIHELMQSKGLTKRTLEEELALIESEEPLGGAMFTSGLDADDPSRNTNPNEDTSRRNQTGVDDKPKPDTQSRQV